MNSQPGLMQSYFVLNMMHVALHAKKKKQQNKNEHF